MEPAKNHSEKQNKTTKKEGGQPLTFMRFSGLAFEMLAFILLGVWVGHTFDDYLDIVFPIFTLSLSMAGLAGGIYYLIKKLPS